MSRTTLGSNQNESTTKTPLPFYTDIITYYEKSNVASTLATANTTLKELSSDKKIYSHELTSRISKVLSSLVVLQNRLTTVGNAIIKFKPPKNVAYTPDTFKSPWNKLPKNLKGIFNEEEKYNHLQKIVLNLEKDIADTQAAFDLAGKIIQEAPAETSSRRSNHHKRKSSELARRSSVREDRSASGEETKLLKHRSRKDTRRHSYSGHQRSGSGGSNAPVEIAPLPPTPKKLTPTTSNKTNTSKKWLSKNLLFFVGKRVEEESWLSKWLPFYRKDQMQLAKLFMSGSKEDDTSKKYKEFNLFSNKHTADKTQPKLLVIFSELDKKRKEAEKIENQWMTDDDAKAIATEYTRQTKTACCRSGSADQLALFLHSQAVDIVEKRVAVLYYLERHGRKDPLAKIILARKNSKDASLYEVDVNLAEAPRLG